VKKRIYKELRLASWRKQIEIFYMSAGPLHTVFSVVHRPKEKIVFFIGIVMKNLAHCEVSPPRSISTIIGHAPNLSSSWMRTRMRTRMGTHHPDWFPPIGPRGYGSEEKVG
jgi:hypothetical protein